MKIIAITNQKGGDVVDKFGNMPSGRRWMSPSRNDVLVYLRHL